MKTTMLAYVMVGALTTGLLASEAEAKEPITLTTAQLDTVTAGVSVTDSCSNTNCSSRSTIGENDAVIIKQVSISSAISRQVVITKNGRVILDIDQKFVRMRP